jgi:hypothetical protein
MPMALKWALPCRLPGISFCTYRSSNIGIIFDKIELARAYFWLMFKELHLVSHYHDANVYTIFIFQAYGLHNAQVSLEREHHINSTGVPNQTLVTKTNRKPGSFTTTMILNCGKL